MARIRARLKEYKSVDQAVSKTINFMKKWKSTETLVESYIKETVRVNSCLKKQKNKRKCPDDIGWYLRTILQIGNYYDTIMDYEKIFGPNSVYIVDGHYEITNPNEEFKSLIEYFGLDPTLIEFKFNKQKGFYCLDRPVQFCLSKEKGHRGKVDIYEKYPELSLIQEGYKSQMTKLFQHIYKCNSVSSCCKTEVVRFRATLLGR